MASSLRRQALRIFSAAVQAAAPRRSGAPASSAAKRQHVSSPAASVTALNAFRNVYVVGAGKASVENGAGRGALAGEANPRRPHQRQIWPRRRSLRRIEINECGHPCRTSMAKHGARAHRRNRCAKPRPNDLVICLISGGASALLPLPAPPVTLEDKQATTQAAARMRRQYSRDQLRPQTHLGHSRAASSRGWLIPRPFWR